MKKNEINNSTFIEGNIINLRNLVRQDLYGNYFDWFNNQENDQYTTHALFPNNIEKMEEYFEASKNNNILLLAIIHKNDNKHVGNIVLRNFDWINRNAEYAIIIGERNYHGKGIGTEATKMILNHGFSRYNLHMIYLDVHEKNTGAIKIYQKAGFKIDGKIRHRFLRNGEYEDNLLMTVLSDEFYKNNN